jgi:hypothetical protein
MPDIRESVDTKAIEALSAAELHQRYQLLKSELGPNPGAVEDDGKLHEMVLILGALRRKSAGPPKASGGSQKGPKVEPALEDL